MRFPMEQLIRIKGARQHNLKNVSLEIPKNKLIVFTGISGSGKSSLAFDTIYAEGQRRYVESLSSYARQFLGIMDKPDVDMIEGLSPAISIDQKSTSHNPRSTVGTVTEIYDYLRLLFARIGHPHCPTCGNEISKLSSEQIVTMIINGMRETMENTNAKIGRLMIMAPIVRDRKGEYSGLFDNLRSKGFRTIRIDGHIYHIDEDVFLIRTNKHSIDVIIDRITIDRNMLKNPKTTLASRITEAVEQSLGLSGGLVIAGNVKDKDFTFPEKPKKIEEHIYSERFACARCNTSVAEIEPRTFSFNSPHGACGSCSGIGTILTVDPERVLQPSLSITEGGILPFAKSFSHDTWYSRVVLTVAQQCGIDTRVNLSRLSDNQKSILLYGTGTQVHEVSGTNRFGETTAIHETFSGIISELKKRYGETESEYVRTEIEKYMRQEVCKECAGKRLKKESLTVTIGEKSIADVTEWSIVRCLEWSEKIQRNNKSELGRQEEFIAKPILKEISTRLSFLASVGLEYLTLARSATTLAGGEAQRIRLASQIGSGLTGVLYVLDEPSIGLHTRDNNKLIATLKQLRDLGNTVLVVEHDREMMEAADYLVDFGPGAGEHGGSIVASGTVREVKRSSRSLTAKYLNNKKIIYRQPIDKSRRTGGFRRPQKDIGNGCIDLIGARQNNLKNINVSFPLGKLIAVTGVSGSGKSTLVVETLYWALYNHINPYSKTVAGQYDRTNGLERMDKVILIDQSPIGRTPRSNPATYTGIFTYIRDMFAMLPESRMKGYMPGRFSFNVKGGRCEACEGEGQIKIEMQFMADIYVTCEVCNGSRYNSETLDIRYREKNIADVLAMTVEESLIFFTGNPMLREKLQTLADVGLGYIHIGQPATTLSGGEAQRVKLSSELNKRATGNTVYILDEPTTGLHFADLECLLHVLHRLTSYGNTVIVIEHNLDVIKNADWIIDLGPEGGDAGGEVVACGTPQNIIAHTGSYTGQYLKKILQ